MEMKKKRGKLSKQEKEYIRANHDTVTVKDIAHHLRRSEDVVLRHIAAEPVVEKIEEQTDWVSRLHASAFWLEVRKGLMGNEVQYFEKSWASYNDQFSSSTDILATDELMIKDLIMLDIFSMRAIAEQTNATRLIVELEKEIKKEEDTDAEVRNQLDLANWRSQVNSLNAAKSALTKSHLDYQKQKDTKLRDLKGSRDQRFKQIEESRRNIFELIKELDKHHVRMKEGRLAEKVKLAADKVAEDWNELHKYEDGEVDKPFLSPEGEISDRLQNEQEQADRSEND